MGYSPTAPFTLTTYSASTGSTAAADYMGAIDSNMLVFRRLGTNMAVSEQTTLSLRDMSVHVMAGWNFRNGAFNEIAAQDSTQIATPVNAPRIDRIVADSTTGLISVVTGAEAAAPSAPAIPSGKIPLAQLYLTPDTTRIGNSMLTDERIWWDSAFGLPVDYQEFKSTGPFTWVKPPGTSTNALTRALLWGGGGGGIGSNGGGGGGGACVEIFIPTASLAATVSGSIGPGGGNSAAGTASVFNGISAYGGGPAVGSNGGGGGGVLGASTGVAGGAPADGIALGDGAFGGGRGAAAFVLAGNAAYGGGGGGAGGSTNLDGGKSVYGGGGGAAKTSAGGSGVAGLSIYGGSGGAVNTAGSAPGGGGGGSTVAGGGAAGARGECRVYTWR